MTELSSWKSNKILTPITIQKNKNKFTIMIDWYWYSKRTSFTSISFIHLNIFQSVLKNQKIEDNPLEVSLFFIGQAKVGYRLKIFVDVVWEFARAKVSVNFKYKYFKIHVVWEMCAVNQLNLLSKCYVASLFLPS